MDAMGLRSTSPWGRGGTGVDTSRIDQQIMQVQLQLQVLHPNPNGPQTHAAGTDDLNTGGISFGGGHLPPNPTLTAITPPAGLRPCPTAGKPMGGSGTIGVGALGVPPNDYHMRDAWERYFRDLDKYQKALQKFRSSTPARGWWMFPIIPEFFFGPRELWDPNYDPLHPQA